MEIDFIQHLSKSLNEDSRDSTAAVVLYGETAQTVKRGKREKEVGMVFSHDKLQA